MIDKAEVNTFLRNYEFTDKETAEMHGKTTSELLDMVIENCARTQMALNVMVNQNADLRAYYELIQNEGPTIEVVDKKTAEEVVVKKYNLLQNLIDSLLELLGLLK